MADPIRVLVTRGGTVESVHEAHAVAVQDGAVVAEAGNGSLVTFIRSAAKPFQALPLARARADLNERDLAIASSSHLAGDAQLAAVEALLAKAPADVKELDCGPDKPRERLRHPCSGKHAGMLALCRAQGWPSEEYRYYSHPVQKAALAEIAAAAEVPADEIPTAVDGCGVVTFALPLERMAFAFSRLEQLEAGAKVAAAMRARWDLIRGPDGIDTHIMWQGQREGWVAKGGAEGLMCAVGPGGLGIALKVADGNGRAVGPAVGRFLFDLGYTFDALAADAIWDSHRELAGEVVTEP